MTKHYGFRKVYISIESNLKRSDFKEIRTYINEQSLKHRPWNKYIILRSHLLTDNDSKNCKVLYEKICKKNEASCKKKKSTIWDKIGTKSIELRSKIYSKLPFLKMEEVIIPPYTHVGFCKIDITKRINKV
jgi:ssDNA-specific exonuclease RecJ